MINAGLVYWYVKWNKTDTHHITCAVLWPAEVGILRGKGLLWHQGERGGRRGEEMAVLFVWKRVSEGAG